MNIHYHPHHHLNELEARDDHSNGFRDPVAQGPQSIVPVHKGMDGEVEDDVPAGRGNVLGVSVPGVEQDRDVVIPVEKDEALFPKDNEDRVTQFQDFRENEDPCPKGPYRVVTMPGKGKDNNRVFVVVENPSRFLFLSPGFRMLFR